MSAAKSSFLDPKAGFEWQLELVMTNMAASGVISGKEAAKMATDSIRRAWASTLRRMEKGEEEDEEGEQGIQGSYHPLLPTIKFLTPRKDGKSPVTGRLSSNKKRIERLVAPVGTPIKKRRGNGD